MREKLGCLLPIYKIKILIAKTVVYNIKIINKIKIVLYTKQYTFVVRKLVDDFLQLKNII